MINLKTTDVDQKVDGAVKMLLFLKVMNYFITLIFSQ